VSNNRRDDRACTTREHRASMTMPVAPTATARQQRPPVSHAGELQQEYLRQKAPSMYRAPGEKLMMLSNPKITASPSESRGAERAVDQPISNWRKRLGRNAEDSSSRRLVTRIGPLVVVLQAASLRRPRTSGDACLPSRAGGDPVTQRRWIPACG
jgi:hypothetical protein